jgi:hypothetical protein
MNVLEGLDIHPIEALKKVMHLFLLRGMGKTDGPDFPIPKQTMEGFELIEYIRSNQDSSIVEKKVFSDKIELDFPQQLNEALKVIEGIGKDIFRHCGRVRLDQDGELNDKVSAERFDFTLILDLADSPRLAV